MAAKDSLNTFWNEIRERKIRKWLAIYLSTGLTILGTINLFSGRYPIPMVIFDIITIVLIFGLISVIYAAWKHGRTGMQKLSKGEFLFHSIIIISAIITFFLIQNKVEELPEFRANSIAVLPFLNLSDNQEDEYFTDGITEDILIQLSKIRDLKVISRSSVQKYKNVKKTIPEIGKELGVETILEGSVRRIGKRVRITGQLINTSNDEHIWAENFDREITDIFSIQSDVAKRIADALKIKLTSKEKTRIENKPTNNIEAYTYYLKGREYYSHYTKEDNEMAINLFKKSLQMDPNYALAYSGLADAYSQRVQRFEFDRSWLDSSGRMSEKAIQLDPDIAEPYKALGLYYDMKGYARTALKYYLKAAEINPNYAPAIANIGSIYWWKGEYDLSFPWLTKNILVNPTRAAGYNSLGLLNLALTKFDIAEKWFRTAMELQPNYVPAIANLVKLKLIKGEVDSALIIGKKYFSSFSKDPLLISAIGDVYFFKGNLDSSLYYYKMNAPSVELGSLYYLNNKKNEGIKILNSLIDSNKKWIDNYTEEFTPFYDLARIYSILNNKQEAIDWFDKAVKSGWYFYPWSEKDPVFANIKNEQGFKDIIKRMKAKIVEMNNNIVKK